MSYPPFGSPLFGGGEEDFSFPIEPTNDPTNQSIEEIRMFLDGDDDENLIPLIGNITQETTIEWAREIEQVIDHDKVVHQGPTCDGDGNDNLHRPLVIIDDDHQGGIEVNGEGTSTKKLDHNAKERVRRLKLNASYVGLRSLLPPHPKKTKEKWSAPYIIDRALDYIPRLQEEIDKLTHDKSNMISVIGEKQQQMHKEKQSTLTLSINEVENGELIIQICHHKDKLDHNFSALIEKLEGDDFRIVGASSMSVSEHRSCFHLHLQMGETPVEADYVAVLQTKLISWLS